MEVVKITPQGFCYGVVNAIKYAVNASENLELPKPIHILGMIVHNEHITNALSNLGLVTIDEDNKNRLELLDNITSGTVIFTAHGVSDEVRKKAIDKGLVVVDASCKDVLKTHDLIKEKINDGYYILYIGKRNHPETESAISINRKQVLLVENISDVENLNLNTEKLLITNQTTMSIWDIWKIVEAIKEKYEFAVFMQEVCNATLVRQKAVVEKAKGLDLVFVVGDPKSNNTKKLVNVCEEQAGVNAVRIGSLDDLDLGLLSGVKRVGVTSGASTPTMVTNEVIEFLKMYDETKKVKPKSSLQSSDYLKFK